MTTRHLTFASRTQKHINASKSLYCFRHSCLTLANDSCIQANYPQTFAPSLRLLHIFKKVSEIFALAFSFLEFERHYTSYNIVAMLKDLFC